MRKLIYILFAIISSFGLFSCEDVIDVKLDQGETLLVVDGNITDDTSVNYTITLTQTTPYFDNGNPPAVTGAFVEIKDFDESGTLIITDTLHEQIPGSGKYISSKLNGKTNHSYVLTILAMGEQYRAETMIRRIPEIDSITYTYKEKSAFNEEGYFIKYHGPEPVGKGDYYRFKTYRNGKLENKPANLTWASDELVDGNYIGAVEMNFEPFALHDTISVELLTITKDEYHFLTELFYQTSGGGPFSTPPANVRTNIINVNPNGKKAVGYFGGHGIRSKTIILN